MSGRGDIRPSMRRVMIERADDIRPYRRIAAATDMPFGAQAHNTRVDQDAACFNIGKPAGTIGAAAKSSGSAYPQEQEPLAAQRTPQNNQSPGS